MERVLKEANITMEDLDNIVATGWGRENITFANKVITEITCHAIGAHFLIPETRTVIDIGGQDSKVMSIDEQGRVLNFAMNDKCAAGTGRFLEVMATVLEVSLEELGTVALTSENPCPINSTCTVFAETEVTGHRAQGKATNDIILGLLEAMSRRIVQMGRPIGYRKEVVFTGGVAKNIGVKRALEKGIGMDILVPEEPQIVGALGAALLAKNKAEGIKRPS
jgi:predicted CoA-substrate-specific enzyme activase